MGNVALGLFLAAHGMIHLGYIIPAPNDPKYPFSLRKSWLRLPEAPVHFIGVLLSVIAVVGFALSGLATANFIVPQSWALSLTTVSAIASLLLLILFWHTWLILGIVINIALLWLIWR